MLFEICTLCGARMSLDRCSSCGAVRHCSTHRVPNVEVNLPAQSVTFDGVTTESAERMRVCPLCEGGREYVERFPMPARGCGACIKCLDDPALPPWENPSMHRMIVCPSCGNKRCPKASDHENACTGSNEPGQKGSVYA